MSDHKRGRWQRTRAPDKGSLAAIYDDCHQPIYCYVYRLVGDVETARDLVADVFQRLLQAVQNGSGPDRNPKAWLYRTAHNLVVDYYRRQEHRRHLLLDEELVMAGDDPVGIAERRISAAQVRAALHRLTPDQQQVIALKFLEGLSSQEVADVLEKPVGAVKALQHRALSALRRQLAAEDKERVVA